MDNDFIIKQLTDIIDEYDLLYIESGFNGLDNITNVVRQSLMTRAKAAIHRITGINSDYSRDIVRIINQYRFIQRYIPYVIGVVKALKIDLENGYLKKYEELIHADIFSDFLEMACHLNDNNYKGPAAVLAGSTLESHIKKLAIKNSVEIIINQNPVKADKLNSDLAKLKIYNILDQKSITSWLDLRNKAAHGKYDEFDNIQVKLMIEGISNFISRNIA